MACTVAVEEAIDAHYADQIGRARTTTRPSCATPSRRSAPTSSSTATSAWQHGAEQAPGYRLLSAAIKAGCTVAIWVSERI